MLKLVNSTCESMVCFPNPVTFIIFTLFHNHNVVLQLDELSTEVVVPIITFILTLIIATVITSIITYICVKRKFEKILQDFKNEQQQNKTVFYEEVGPDPSNKDDLELQPNPAYGTSKKVTMDTNPAYKSCK